MLPHYYLLGILNQDNQSAHLCAHLPRVHHMAKNVAVERIDASGCGPGVERQIVGFTGSDCQCIFLDRLRKHVAIFSNDIEEVSMQVHGMDHFTRVNHANVNSLTMLHIYGLGVGEALAVDHIVAANFTDELSIFNISMNLLLVLESARTR